MSHSVLCLMAVVGHTSTPPSGGSVTLEPWQVINLVGAPLLAILFVRPVIDDLRGWFRSLRGESS